MQFEDTRSNTPATSDRPPTMDLGEEVFPTGCNRGAEKRKNIVERGEIYGARVKELFEEHLDLVQEIVGGLERKYNLGQGSLLGIAYLAFRQCVSEYNPDRLQTSDAEDSFRKFIRARLKFRIFDHIRGESHRPRDLVRFKRAYERARELAEEKVGHTLNGCHPSIIERFNSIRPDRNYRQDYRVGEVEQRLLQCELYDHVPLSCVVRDRGRSDDSSNFSDVVGPVARMEGVFLEDRNFIRSDSEYISIDVRELLNLLPPREKLIVTLYYLEQKPLWKIGEMMIPTVTEARVSQLRKESEKLLKEFIWLKGALRMVSLEDNSTLIPDRMVRILRVFGESNGDYNKFCVAYGETLSGGQMLSLVRACSRVLKAIISGQPKLQERYCTLPITLSQYLFMSRELEIKESVAAKLAFPNLTTQQAKVIGSCAIECLERRHNQVAVDSAVLSTTREGLSAMDELIYVLINDEGFSYKKLSEQFEMSEQCVRESYGRAKGVLSGRND